MQEQEENEQEFGDMQRKRLRNNDDEEEMFTLKEKAPQPQNIEHVVKVSVTLWAPNILFQIGFTVCVTLTKLLFSPLKKRSSHLQREITSDYSPTLCIRSILERDERPLTDERKHHTLQGVAGGDSERDRKKNSQGN